MVGGKPLFVAVRHPLVYGDPYLTHAYADESNQSYRGQGIAGHIETHDAFRDGLLSLSLGARKCSVYICTIVKCARIVA